MWIGRVPRRLSIVVAVGLIAIVGLAWSARAWQVRRLAPFTPLAEAFLDLAVAGDSAGLAALATDPEPVQRILTIQRRAPEQLALMRHTLHLRAGLLEPDKALVRYGTDALICPSYLEHRGDFQVQFSRVAGKWRIDYAAPTC
jgi:hypothetical protein